MAPRTHHTQRVVRQSAGGSLDGSQISLEDATGLNISNGTIDVGQDTFAMDNFQNLQEKGNTPQPPMKAIQTRPRKHAQSLTLTSKGEATRQPSSDGAKGSNKGKQRVGQPLQQTSSFYPSRGGTSSLLNIQTNPIQPQTVQDFDQDSDEPEAEAEEDWFDEQAKKMTALPQGQQEKAMAIEKLQPSQRPTWTGSAGPSTSVSMAVPRAKQGCTIATSQPVGCGSPASMLLPASDSESESVPPTAKAPGRVQLSSSVFLVDGSTTVNIVVPSEAPRLREVQVAQPQFPPTWPAEMEIRTIPGSNHVILTIQGTLLRTIIQDVFKNLRATMLFQNVFPDGTLTLSFICDALVTAARQCGPAAVSIYTQLLNDTDYFAKIIPLVHVTPCARISLFQAEVKECCNVIAMTVVVGLPTRTQIARHIQDQLSNYNYTFPGIPRGPSQGVLVKHSKLYRNMWIVDAICSSFFSGGNSSFTTHFKYLFPSSETHDLVMVYEVSIPMVALAATAVGLYLSVCSPLQVADG
ncbi:hypothetical protein EDB86DRAFT_3248312 [Lactarius hatsudake]|nr:hypothetical protein EDB86DRAFT_3248312 [Lactarius hatsudake]